MLLAFVPETVKGWIGFALFEKAEIIFLLVKKIYNPIHKSLYSQIVFSCVFSGV